MKTKKSKICIISATPITIYFFFQEHIKELAKDYDITIIYNKDIDKYIPSFNLPVEEKHIKIERKISIISDLKALISLFRFFKSNKFVCVISIAPKAGLLSMTASFFARIKIRLHIFQGEVWANKKGLYRLLLKFMDKITSLLSTNILAVSNGEKFFLHQEGVVNKDNCHVIGNGSISGVDINLSKNFSYKKNELRQELGFSQDDVICIFVGRLQEDKGIFDLIHAFNLIAEELPQLKLLIVGPDEDNIHTSLVSDIYSDRIIVKGYTSEPEKFMCISDFLCLPSHREGFGMVILEAAACGIPSIGSDIYGIQDAIVHNKTGLLFEKSNPEYLSISIKILTNNKQLRLKMGQNANKRVLENFSKEFVVKEYLKHIHYIIQQSM